MTTAAVRLWGRTIGAVTMAADQDHAVFQYDPAFADSGIEVAPLTMPLARRPYAFPELSRATFHGLPGLLADSLPDKFGNALIDAWLATQGRAPESFDAVERLCYTGVRGMGALEYLPIVGPRERTSQKIEVDALVALASEVLTRRLALQGRFDGDAAAETLHDILMVGTSAGGARAKAVIAWNPQTHEVRSGQVAAPAGFEHWIMKFDGVAGNKDKDLDDPRGFGAIEYAYHLMARAAGITMADCRLFEENGRRHFMSRRFDRGARGEKLHMLSLGAMAHFDYNLAGAYSYEQAFLALQRLELPTDALEQQFRRMAFNVVARNQDDHVKNIAFLMDRDGTWSLAPAFDVTYGFNPGGVWTATHQMSLNGKRDGFTRADFRACARVAKLKGGRDRAILDEVIETVRRWPEFAAQAQVLEPHRQMVARALRLDLPAD